MWSEFLAKMTENGLNVAFKGEPKTKMKKYYRFYSIRRAGRTIFSFQILKHKPVGQFQPRKVFSFVSVSLTQMIQPVYSVSM